VSESVIEVEGLTKSFAAAGGWQHMFRQPSQKVVLSSIDLSVRRGEIFGLLGPNGAGKTTLIKILCGLVLPDGGRATVNGWDIVGESLQVRRSIGVVYGDERSFYWRLSVLENLRFYATLYGLPRAAADARIAELLRRLDLADVANVRMHSFSSGMKQRAAIARGLINDPELIFMDEPTRSLDPVGTAELHRLIRNQVSEAGRTVLLATNSMSEAEALCDRLTLIDHGGQLLTGTTADFRARAYGEIVYRLTISGKSSQWLGGLSAIPGILNIATQFTNGLSHDIELTIDSDGKALPKAIRFLVEQSAEILTCTKVDLPLEEVFRRVVHTSRQGDLERSVV
jgi:ABC-2 type transport system ATP-binding protein